VTPGAATSGAGIGEVPLEAFASVVAGALDEDLATGDPTSSRVEGHAKASLASRSRGVVAGLPAVELTLGQVAERLGLEPASFEPRVEDGAAVGGGDLLGTIGGPARVVLAAERTLLNLLGHLSGVATLTAAFVDAVEGTGAAVRDTRKTLPGLRLLEKYAVRAGGGRNHRMSLGDALLVKDNHIRAAGGLGPAVAKARAAAPGLPLEVEVENLQEVAEALAAGCELLLLDNMDTATMSEAVAMASGRARTEASGGITLANARESALTGVDFIAVGALTHSAPALDIGLDW
jgi:nicotinate-nucleotide pyrophosphorylase (carboxylating)